MRFNLEDQSDSALVDMRDHARQCARQYTELAQGASRRANRYQKEIERRRRARPTWPKMNGQEVVIAEMRDGHLVNSLRVCLRKDPRYTFDKRRMEGFRNLILEAENRGIPASRWADLEVEPE